ncbi:AMP-binding protein, partial [Janthinobacterium sp.]|uniref:AMP-binding protein n=1 Tax=Janthinobacterium sp. TaxID=1871054 RepID=UPI00258A2728
LFPEQIAYISNHAEDQVLLFDLTFLPVVEKIAADCTFVRHFVLMCDRDRMPANSRIPDLLCYEDLIDTHSDDYTWPVFDENSAAALCYTSGTTGNPKGALYSHRSTVLHAYASAMPSALNVRATDTV